MTHLLGIRPEDRTNAGLGFFTLAAVMAAHAMLETARDALFLARLPASQLPWAYLAIAALAVLMARANQVCALRYDRRRTLALTLLISALGTAVLWGLVARGSVASLFAVYVWSGLVASVVVVQFWTVVGDLVTVGQAKRMFATITAGAVLGATLGSLAADRLVTILAARHLLLAAGLLLAGAAAIPLLFPAQVPATMPTGRRNGAGAGVTLLRSQPYLRRLMALVLLSAVVVTGVDYVFKATVAQQVAPEDLGAYFARFYLYVNALALVLQLFVASRLLQRLGVSRSMLLLPALLLLGVVGMGAAASLAIAASLSVLLLKGADATLRHSVHRTAMEVLYVPLPPQVRVRFKGLIDSIGQRGGQALASVTILAAVAFGATPLHIALAAGLLTTLWLLLILDIKPHYLELFRANLRQGGIETQVDLAELDLHSLEALLTSLNSSEDDEVLASLELLAIHGRVRVIPALILYHPSPAIVLRALELFIEHERVDTITVARRLLHGDSDELRAAALRALTVLAPDQELLEAHFRDEAPIVHATALVGLIAANARREEALWTDLDGRVGEERPKTRLALASAIRHQRDPRFASSLLRMADAPDPSVRLEVARAMAAIPDPMYLPALLRMLPVARLRPAARKAFVQIGAVAFEFLTEALRDRSLSPATRRHLPRTIHRFDARPSARALTEHLLNPDDASVAHKVLRALGRLKADNPHIKIDRAILQQATRQALARAVQLLDWRVFTEAAHRAKPALATSGAELLIATLQEKEAAAVERVFRLLGLRHPDEDFELLHQSLLRGDQRARAASRELLEHVVTKTHRAAVLALVDDVSDEARLRAAAAAVGHARTGATYEERLSAMLHDESETVQSLAAYHVAELGLRELEPQLREAIPARGGVLAEVIDRALELLASPVSDGTPA